MTNRNKKSVPSKTNVKYVSKEFFVNQDKGKVICKLTFDIDLSKLKCWPLIDNNTTFNEYMINSYPNYMFAESDNINFNVYRFTVYGKATKNSEDVFNEQTGVHIALTRAQQKAFKIAENIYSKISEILVNYQLEVTNLISASLSSDTKCMFHISELIDNNNE